MTEQHNEHVADYLAWAFNYFRPSAGFMKDVTVSVASDGNLSLCFRSPPPLLSIKISEDLWERAKPGLLALMNETMNDET